MNFGKMLSFISPAYGMATGHGLGKAMPYMSPGFGALSGKGPFSEMGGAMAGMGGVLPGLMGGHGGQEGGGQMPQQAMPGAMGDVQSPMQPVQQDQAQAPTGFGQAGMFGGQGQNGFLEMLRQRMMQGGGY